LGVFRTQEYGWIDFSHETYGLFPGPGALKQELDVTYLEYGHV